MPLAVTLLDRDIDRVGSVEGWPAREDLEWFDLYLDLAMP